jgi:hypothetical protein
MPIDIKSELLRFLTEHVKIHGADFRSEKYINECCDLWLPKYGKAAEKVRGEALKFWREKGGK